MGKISRRSLLRTSAVVAGSAFAWHLNPLELLDGVPAYAQHKPDMKFPTAARDRLAVATWPFRAEIESPTNEYRDKKRPGVDLSDFAAKVRERFGVPGVEPLSSHFPSTEERYIKTFREKIEKAGVHVVNIPVDNECSYYDADAANRKKVIDNCSRWVDIAVLLGSPSLRTSIAPAKTSKPDAKVAAETLRVVVDYAAGKNIVIDLENDNPVSEDPSFIVKLLEEVHHPYLYALPDFCNSMTGGNEKFGYDALTALFPHAYNICHVKDSEVGEGGKVFRVDLKKAFAILKASHYKGYCSMEWEGPEDPDTGTRRLIAASLENLA